MSTPHRCHFPRCMTHTPRKLLYCPPHWFMVPAALRRRVWAAYNALPHGPAGNCLRVSREWIDAVKAAEEAIKTKLAARVRQSRPRDISPLWDGEIERQMEK